MGEITPASFEVADCSAILPVEDEAHNFSKLSFALDTPQENNNNTNPPVMVHDEEMQKAQQD